MKGKKKDEKRNGHKKWEEIFFVKYPCKNIKEKGIFRRRKRKKGKNKKRKKEMYMLNGDMGWLKKVWKSISAQS